MSAVELDLGLGFAFPVAVNASGRTATASGLEHLRVSVLMRLLTRRGEFNNGTWSGGERVLRPWLGSDLWKYVDRPMNDVTAALIRNSIYLALRDEDRMTITAIPITTDGPGNLIIGINANLANGITVAFQLSYDRELKRWQGQWAA